MPGLYKDVAKSLKAANILPKRIFITGYPEPTTDESGNICPSSFLPGIGHHDWYWLGVVGRLLGNQVAATKQSQGWTPVMEIGSNFFGHGYCAAESYFQSIPGSFYTQGNPFGTFHSKAYGHFLMSLNVKRALCKQMYGNDKCEGFPRKPQ